MTRSAPLLITGLVSMLALGAVSGVAHADPSAKPTTESAKKLVAKNPVVATVNGHAIHLSDVARAAQSLPAQLQNAPPQQLYPILLNRLIEERALLVQARKADIVKQKDVQVALHHAKDRVLETAYLRSQVEPHITATEIATYYKTHFTEQKQPHQVKASQILLKTKAEADKVIAQLNKGAKFAALASKYNPQTKDGGELGWFARGDMVKPFADAAFALKPGTYTKTPVQSTFGFHVIMSEGKRIEPVPALATVQGTIKRKLAEHWIKTTMSKARGDVKVKMFNPDGSPMKKGAAVTNAAPAKADTTKPDPTKMGETKPGATQAAPK